MEIIVNKESTKQQLLRESQYLHDVVTDFDLNIEELNILSHIYMNPDMVIVKSNKENNE